jgi:hypothetical protein
VSRGRSIAVGWFLHLCWSIPCMFLPQKLWRLLSANGGSSSSLGRMVFWVWSLLFLGLEWLGPMAGVGMAPWCCCCMVFVQFSDD